MTSISKCSRQPKFRLLSNNMLRVFGIGGISFCLAVLIYYTALKTVPRLSHIHSHPSVYYDTEKFRLPCSLDTDTLGLGDLYTLAAYLKEHCFCFKDAKVLGNLAVEVPDAPKPPTTKMPKTPPKPKSPSGGESSESSGGSNSEDDICLTGITTDCHFDADDEALGLAEINQSDKPLQPANTDEPAPVSPLENKKRKRSQSSHPKQATKE